MVRWMCCCSAPRPADGRSFAAERSRVAVSDPAGQGRSTVAVVIDCRDRWAAHRECGRRAIAADRSGL